MNQNSQKSFTLMELLIVIAVIAILAAIVLISLDSARQRANTGRGMQFYQIIKSALATDLVGEWSFDSQSSPGGDDSGNRNNCTLRPVGLEPTWRDNGQVRGALEFSGGNYIDCGARAAFDITDEITVEAWARPDGVVGYNNIVVKRNTNNIGGYIIHNTSSNYLLVYVYINGVGWRSTRSISPVYSPGKWIHVLMTYNGQHLKAWANGTEVGSNPVNGKINIPSPNASLEIGGWGTAGGQYWDGWVDEVRVYKRALSAKEIQQLYALGKIRHFAGK